MITSRHCEMKTIASIIVHILFLFQQSELQSHHEEFPNKPQNISSDLTNNEIKLNLKLSTQQKIKRKLNGGNKVPIYGLSRLKDRIGSTILVPCNGV